MSSIMDGLSGDKFDRVYRDKILIERIYGLFRGQSKKMTVASILLVINTIIGIIAPLIISKGIDLLNENLAQNMVLPLAGLITILGIITWVFGFIQKKYSKEAIAQVIYDIQNKCFKSVIKKDMSFFDQNSSAKVISRITGDTDILGNVINLVIDFFRDLMIFIVLIGIILFINPGMTLILLAFIPVIIGVSLGFRRIARKVSQQLFRAIAEVNLNIKESLTGMPVTKNFRKEEYMYNEFKETNYQTFKTNFKQGLVFSAILPVMNILSSLGASVIIGFGAMKVIGGTLSFGELYLFFQAVGLIWNPVISITSFWSQLQEGFAAAERIFSLLDAKSQVIQTGNLILRKIKGEIEFKDVSISYGRKKDIHTPPNGQTVAVEESTPNDEGFILNQFSLKINPGESIALVGHTGAGKTTIVRLILRFYEFQTGQILIDNIDIRTLDLVNYRKFIGYVPQTPFLFSGTVLENILYGNPGATEEDVRKAVNSIKDGTWMLDLRDGLKTDVGERGGRLSFGQRQLIALVRVIVKNPSILILDEATASIDPITEYHVQAALKLLMRGRTSIVIAHRLTTVKAVDRIIVLKKGKIIEAGTHEKLLNEGTYYKNLYNTYYRHQSLDYIEKRWSRERMVLKPEEK